jgi:hypothetical protein
MRWGGTVGAIAVVGTLLLAPGAASAATRVGNDCSAPNTAPVNSVLIQLANASSSLPIEAPAGVVTQWRVTSSRPAASQRLKVLAPTGPKDEYRLVGESEAQAILPTENVFDARITVPAGARFGLYAPGPDGPLYCNAVDPGDLMGSNRGDLLATDAPVVFQQTPGNYRVPVSAVVEPDVDGDGYGDETQDACPQSAASRAQCPRIVLDVFPAVGKGAVTVIVIADHPAPVTVTATAPAIGRAAKRKLTIRGGTQSVVPDQLFRFKLRFPSKLRSALRKLPAKRSLRLTVTATATNPVGQTTSRISVVKLRGQRRPR